MIRNVRQYRITKAQVAKLDRALQQLTAASGRSALAHPRLQKAQEDALRSQIADLHEQLAEYEALRGQTRLALTLESFEEFPRALIKARIAAGISQKELAKRLGLKEQQIQRYEATEYASASLARVAAVVRALNLTVREELTLPPAKKSPAETEEGVADAET
jgi:ribosome-binding protein aMBF1 (putative translation factor)